MRLLLALPWLGPGLRQSPTGGWDTFPDAVSIPGWFHALPGSRVVMSPRKLDSNMKLVVLGLRESMVSSFLLQGWPTFPELADWIAGLLVRVGSFLGTSSPS